MSDASDFLTKWVRKNIHADHRTHSRRYAHCRSLGRRMSVGSSGRKPERGEVIDAAGGNLLTFMVSELNRAADA